MLEKLQRRMPHFSVSSLMLVTTAVAIGFAISQSPKAAPDKELAFFDFYLADMRWAQGFTATACVLFIFELARQAKLLYRQRRTLDARTKFASSVAIFERVAFAASILALTLLTLLLNRGVLAMPENHNLLQVWTTFIPDLLLAVVLIATVRLMLVGRDRLPSRAWIRWSINAIVLTGLATLASYIVINRTTIAMLVHVACNGIEKSHAMSLQRPGLYPYHAGEGFRSFWLAASAVGAVMFAAGLLVWDSGPFRDRPKWGCQLKWGTRTLCGLLIAGLAFFAWWYATVEFPRISPEMASAGSSRSWTDTLAGLLLLGGLALAIGSKLAREQNKSCESDAMLPSSSGLATIAAVPIVMAVGWGLAEKVREALSFSFFGSPDLWGNLEIVAELLFMPETLVSLVLLISAVALLWQVFRRPGIAQPLRPVERADVAWFTLASFALLAVAVPAFAAFGFCYWLGPFV